MADKKNKNENWEKILSFLEKGFAASKKGLKSAGNAISNFGDKSVLRIENTQIKSKIEKRFLKLGEYVYTGLSSKKNASVTLKDQAVKELVSEIDDLFIQVVENKKSIESVDKKAKAAKKSSSGKTAAGKTSSAKKPASRKPASSKKTAGVKKTTASKTPSSRKTPARKKSS